MNFKSKWVVDLHGNASRNAQIYTHYQENETLICFLILFFLFV